MEASGEIRLTNMTMRRMPVLAQSQLAASIPQASGPADYQIDEPITVQCCQPSDSEVASAGMDVAGAGAAGVEAQFGEQFLGSPNGGLYSRAWANGVGRAVKISSLTKSFGLYGLLAGTALDAQSVIDGNITGVQFDVNLGLGVLGYYVPLYGLGSLNALFINNFYPGGWQGYYENVVLNPDVLGNPLYGGYDGLR